MTVNNLLAIVWHVFLFEINTEHLVKVRFTQIAATEVNETNLECNVAIAEE